jgi:YqaJ-like viral recombinase domain
MKLHDADQGSDKWHQLRLGIVTASCMDMIITPTGEKSTQASKLMNRLLAETITKRNCETFKGNIHTDRGKEYEEEAVTNPRVKDVASFSPISWFCWVASGYCVMFLTLGLVTIMR